MEAPLTPRMIDGDEATRRFNASHCRYRWNVRPHSAFVGTVAPHPDTNKAEKIWKQKGKPTMKPCIGERCTETVALLAVHYV